MIKAILFDMDGTLVDTETVCVKIAVSICKELGIILSQEEQNKLIGIPVKDFYLNLLQKKEVNFDLDKVLKKQFEIYENSLKNELVVFPGIIEVFDLLKNNGYKLALVSGSTSSQINIILKALKIKKYFDVILSCDDIDNGKPHPEGYLTASNKLNVLTNECLVIEDAKSGIISGKKAGMKVIGIKNGSNENLSDADIILNKFKDLLDIEKFLKQI